MMTRNYSYGIERDPERLAKNDDDHTKFSNPLEVKLPNAPVSSDCYLFTLFVSLTRIFHAEHAYLLLVWAWQRYRSTTP